MRHFHLLPIRLFLLRFSKNVIIGLAVIFFSLAFGMMGYHFFENLSWTDSFLNASMILSGMGPVNEMNTEAGKLFAGLYALFSGVIFLVVTAFIFSPVIHRLFHVFHLENSPSEQEAP